MLPMILGLDPTEKLRPYRLSFVVHEFFADTTALA